MSSVGGGATPGLGLNLDVKLSDMMGNHRFNGGVWGYLGDLESSNMYGEYWYLKRRVDFQIRYEKQAVLVADDYVYQKYKLEKFILGFSYPLSNASKDYVSADIFFNPFFKGSPD